MPYNQLIVLFGHENSDRKLSAVARTRCELAAQLLEKFPEARVLPTGAFGKHFNTTNHPHHFYLAEYLKTKGVKSHSILPGTDTSNTFEDCVAVRKIATEERYNEVLAVTSEYHAERVNFILERVMPDIPFTLFPAVTPSESLPGEKIKERKSFKRMKGQWPPKYVPSSNPELNKMVYEEAVSEHRHYDTISLAIVSAILVVSAFPFVASFNTILAVNKLGKAGAAVFWMAAAIDFLLLHLYLRAAHNAAIARRILRNVEMACDLAGFSASYYASSSWTIPIRLAVTILGAAMIFILTASGAVVWRGWEGHVCRIAIFSGAVLLTLGVICLLMPGYWWTQSRTRYKSLTRKDFDGKAHAIIDQ
jgi:hypothetical protein